MAVVYVGLMFYVLDRGVLVEYGTHEKLMARQGSLYYHLAQQQLAL